MKLAVLAAILYLSLFANTQLVSPTTVDNYSLYHFMRIAWEPYHVDFLGKTSMDITLSGENSDSVEITTGFPIKENISSFDWIVYGVIPTAAAKITFVVNGGTPIESDTFTISLPEDTTCMEEGSACTDSLDCCSGDCTSEVCGDYLITCYHDGALCSSKYPCCSGGCNSEVCGEPTDCLLIDATCNENEDCCSDVCDSFVCIEPVSCTNSGDLCTSNDECCFGQCFRISPGFDICV